MYRYKKAKDNRVKNIFTIIVIIILTAVLTILLYRMYEGINVYTYEPQEEAKAIKTVQTIDEVKNQSKQIADVVENVTSCVVGISKIKDAGTTIFLKDGSSSLGLGTGVIVSENGYILSNEHVTGSKYSNCYVTLENGKTYTANVVWSDSSIDLSMCNIPSR